MLVNAEIKGNREISHTKKMYHEAHQEIINFLNQSPRPYFDFGRWEKFHWRLVKLLNETILHRLGMVILPKSFWPSFLAFYYDTIFKKLAIGTTIWGISEPEKLDEVHRMLVDDKSKETFQWFLKYRIGYAMVGPLANDIFPYLDFEPNTKITPVRLKKERNCCAIKDYIIDFWQDWNEVQNTWVNEQYLLTGKCEPQTGEVIIDAGGFQGGTAIWFADKVGKSGKVYSFEPLAGNYRRMERNIRRNHLENIIIMNNQGLWDEDTSLMITDNNSASTCTTDRGDVEIQVTKLDSYIRREHMARVDFIKMDIEGAELNALRGASTTIQKFKPKLAISIYHLPNDIYEIPFFIKSLVPEYKLYLSQKFKGWHETVLFASVD